MNCMVRASRQQRIAPIFLSTAPFHTGLGAFKSPQSGGQMRIECTWIRLVSMAQQTGQDPELKWTKKTHLIS